MIEYALKAKERGIVTSEERNNFSSFLTKKTEEVKQKERILAKAEKDRKAAAEQCEKAKKVMNNLDKFLDYLRQI